MKSRYWYFKSFMLLLIIGQSLSLAGQDKIALLLGVGDYPSASGWPSTNAYNDLGLIKETLIQQGFNQNFIYSFLDSACTKKGVQTAFSSFLLPKLKEGMFVFIHFSGIAQQIANPDNEITGLENAIVPFDAPAKNNKTSFDPALFIPNSELELFFRQVQRKIGAKGQLMVSIDASVTPASDKVVSMSRGSDDKMEEAGSEKSTASEQIAFFSKQKFSNGMAPMIGFYSSSFTQLNEEFYTDENEYYGLFSFALCKSLLHLNKEVSYKDWFEKIKLVMNENSSLQTPVIIGDAGLLAFNGKLNGKKNHFDISKIYSKDLMLINAGKLHQIEKGTEFLFYDESISDTSGIKPLAKAIATETRLLDSDLRILESRVNPIPKNSKVFVSSYHYKPLAIRVNVDLSGSALEHKLLTHFSFSPYIKRDVVKPELLILNTKKDTLQLVTRQGEVLFQQAMNTVNLKEIPFTLNEKIAEYLRANFLRNLEIENSSKNSSIQCILLKDGIEKPVDDFKNRVVIGSKIKLRITNNSEKRQYFNVIDVQPDLQINVIIPNEKRAEEYYIEAGQTYTTEFELVVSPPLGRDVIKVIMMSTPLDLRPVIATRGVSNILDTQKAKNPFEIFMGQTFIEHPVTSGEELKINTSELSSVNGTAIEIVEVK